MTSSAVGAASTRRETILAINAKPRQMLSVHIPQNLSAKEQEWEGKMFFEKVKSRAIHPELFLPKFPAINDNIAATRNVS